MFRNTLLTVSILLIAHHDAVPGSPGAYTLPFASYGRNIRSRLELESWSGQPVIGWRTLRGQLRDRRGADNCVRTCALPRRRICWICCSLRIPAPRSIVSQRACTTRSTLAKLIRSGGTSACPPVP